MPKHAKNSTAPPPIPSGIGHYALRRVLECPDIDVLCSPISYYDRGMGGSGPAMTAAESVALAGKMWLAEDDTRTCLGSGDFPGKIDGAKDLWETRTMLLRNLAQEATRNFGTWWMDLGMTGWFNDTNMWEEMRRFEPVDRTFLEKPTAYQPQVAVVIDERSMLLASASAWSVTEPGIYQVRRPLGRMGAPYGQYLLDDVLQGRVRARLWIFLNAWKLSAAEREKLRAVTRGTAVIWCYAPGVYSEGGSSPEGMRELTGIRLAPVKPGKAWAVPTDPGRKLGLKIALGVDRGITPLYAATEAGPEEVLGCYPDGSTAIVMRQDGSGWSVFVGVPGLSSDLLRAVAAKAGIHLYTETDCNVYANGEFLGLHAASDGPLAVNTGRAGQVYDALSGELLGPGPSLSITMKRGETRILRVGVKD